MDFSNYPSNHPNFSMRNHLIPGKFKDESPKSVFSECVFLRSKMYSLKNTVQKLDKSTAKGISRRSKDKFFNHQSYVKALYSDQIPDTVTIPRIINSEHRLYTVTQRKKALSNFNDKFFFQKGENGEFITHSIGHINIHK